MVKAVAWDPWGPEFEQPLAAEFASGGLTQPVILPKIGKMITSILVIIPAWSKATKGLASGRASGHKKKPCHKKGYHDWSLQKADPCSGIKAFKLCDDEL